MTARPNAAIKASAHSANSANIADTANTADPAIGSSLHPALALVTALTTASTTATSPGDSMINPRERDTTADSPDWVFLGEFFQDIGMRDRIRLAVYRNTADHTLHRLTSDEMTSAGPCLIAILTDPPSGREEWHPAWQTDEMRPAVETRARDIARG